MSDLAQGQSMSELFTLVSGGAAYTMTFGFQPDKVVVNNLTDWTATAGGLPISSWFRTQTAAGDAYQSVVIDSNAGQSFNFKVEETNGFTSANTDGGETAFRSLIAGVTAADPAVVETTAAHGLQTNQIVRITDLGSDMPTARGMDQINNKRFSITVVDSTHFSLQDPVSGEDIDSSGYTAWVAGGRISLETRVLQLNNPQVDPYATTPYVPNPYLYLPVVYKLTLGTAVVGGDGDVLNVEVYKFGQVTEIGDVG